MPADDASTSDASVTLRAYESEGDRAALWTLKTEFETALGDAGGEAKAATYAEKMTEAYRERWLAWVDRCVTDRSACVTVAERQEGNSGGVSAAGQAESHAHDVVITDEAPNYSPDGD